MKFKKLKIGFYYCITNDTIWEWDGKKFNICYPHGWRVASDRIYNHWGIYSYMFEYIGA